MSASEPTAEQEAYEWYYIDKTEKTTKGPISLRELDVFIRTNILDSQSYVWREGFSDWKKIYQTEDLKDLVVDTSTEVMESIMRNKIQSSLTQKLESNINQQNFYLGGDGYWHVFNPLTKTWHKQETKPTNNRKKSFDLHEDTKNQKNIIIGDNKAKKEENKEDVSPVSISQKSEGKSEEVQGKKRKFGESLDKILTDDQIKEYEKIKKKREKMKEKKKKKWYDARINSSIYVSGLPLDINEEELVLFFSKCGLIRKDPVKRKKTLYIDNYKVKIYKDQNERPKGDALISYLREESVSICIDLLNDTEIRPGFKIKVEPAKFEQKGDYKERAALKIDEIERKKLESERERQLGWEEEDQTKGLKIIILKNMFHPEEFVEDPNFRTDLELDIVEECEESFGPIEKIQVFEGNSDGVIKVKFKNAVAAEKAIQTMNGRFYNGKHIECFYWDGKTDYKKSREDEEIEKKRIEEFGKWLEETEEETKESEANVNNNENGKVKEIDITEELKKSL